MQKQGSALSSADSLEGLTDLGRVYRDDETGQLYVVTE